VIFLASSYEFPVFEDFVATFLASMMLTTAWHGQSCGAVMRKNTSVEASLSEHDLHEGYSSHLLAKPCADSHRLFVFEYHTEILAVPASLSQLHRLTAAVTPILMISYFQPACQEVTIKSPEECFHQRLAVF
jgi:hypothetical protein